MTSAPNSNQTASRPESSGDASARYGRRAAIDWMRGFVMVLMTIDHASQTWNGGRVAADSAYLLDLATGGPAWVPGTDLDSLQFYTRWITHLCAPTFLFLSGTSLAMSFEKRRGLGMSDWELDRHLFIRAAVILGFEGLLSLVAGQGVMILQVLYAISASMLAMILLRRLPTKVLVGIGLAWLFGSEWVLTQLAPIQTFGAEAAGAAAGGGAAHFSRRLWQVLLFVPGLSGSVYVMYPVTHWLAMMVLGWALGRYMLELPQNDYGSQQVEKLLLLSGLTAILFWSYIRSANDYGNMGLFRDSAAIVQWLHMSKYPPALVYSLMELGLMALFLVGFMRFERRMKGPARRGNPLLVFGQTALFFYVLHFILLGVSAVTLTGGIMLRGLTETYIAAAVTLAALYPVCIGFRSLKREVSEEPAAVHLGALAALRLAERKELPFHQKRHRRGSSRS